MAIEIVVCVCVWWWWFGTFLRAAVNIHYGSEKLHAFHFTAVLTSINQFL